ncbi:hypothetical protein C8J98_102165 [Luteibacter sp. OK325]|uniref:hypothetical protein n=1 Tax=Luteibacter sp. OK325 TaxID=2135670 RepID=UPI000D38E5C8|nr:hypothetical protein [Luteibacter sp. OK325]PTR33978.1 hypothetical protein C8J98_102165 [Luteibacter sp. OK325]
MLTAPSIDILLAWVVVVSMAGVGFNQPSWSRSCTTGFRYYAAQMGHMTLYSGIFLLAYGLVSLAFGWSTGSAPHPLATWLALLLTLSLRAMPSTARYFRQRAHRWASIPGSVLRLSRVMSAARFGTSSFASDARLLLTARGIALDDDPIPAVALARQKLLAATEVFLTIRAWEESPAATTFSLDARPSIDLLRHRFDRLAFRVSHTITSITRLGDVRYLYVSDTDPSRDTGEMDELLRRLVDDMTDEMLEDIRAFYADACLLAAKGTLAMRVTRHGRDALLAKMGFDLGRKKRPTAALLLATFALLVAVSLWLYFTLFPAPAPSSGNSQSLSLGVRFVLLALDIFGSITVAIIPKRHWGFANSGLWQRTPKLFVVASGACAMAVVLAINVGIGAILDGESGAARCLAYSWVLLPFMFAHAAAAAWLIQDHRWSGTASRIKRRLLDASTWAVGLAVASIVSVPILLFLGREPFEFLPRMVLTSLVFGAVYGYFIPESVRSIDAPRINDDSGNGLHEFVPASLRRYVE